MDAQLIAFYSGPDADYDYEIYEQQEFDRSIRQRLRDLGLENPITYYIEYGFRRSDRIRNPVVVIERFDDSFVRINYISSDR